MSLTLTLPPKVTSRAFARLAEINAAAGEAKALRVAVEGGRLFRVPVRDQAGRSDRG